VFDILSGGTLEDRVEQLRAEQRLTEVEIAKMAKGVLQMLAQCHAIGIIHRDIKPGN
jgi:serine/threonine protein kinase